MALSSKFQRAAQVQTQFKAQFTWALAASAMAALRQARRDGFLILVHCLDDDGIIRGTRRSDGTPIAFTASRHMRDYTKDEFADLRYIRQQTNDPDLADLIDRTIVQIEADIKDIGRKFDPPASISPIHTERGGAV
jgi:hypothetical protein